ncbi:hypothetical protein MRX96_020163 [Rhipicephalus microplus]
MSRIFRNILDLEAANFSGISDFKLISSIKEHDVIQADEREATPQGDSGQEATSVSQDIEDSRAPDTVLATERDEPAEVDELKQGASGERSVVPAWSNIHLLGRAQ